MFLIFIKKFSLVLFGLILALIVLEITIRVLLSFLPENLLPTYGIYQKSYPVVGHKLVPNLDGVWSREGFSRVKTNSMGWNDYERNLVKPLNTIRIAIVGDSFIEALQVDKSKAVGQITEFWLEENCNNSETLNSNFEVLSFGVSGWGTSQMYLAILDEVLLFDPDYILLAFFPGNDLKNNIYEVELNPHKPYFEINDQGELFLSREPLLDNSIKKFFYRFVRDRSILVQVIREPIVKIFASNKNVVAETISKSNVKDDYQKKIELIEGSSWGKNLDSKFVQYSWSLTEKLLLKTSQDIKSHNSEMLIMIVSRGEIVDFERDYVFELWAKDQKIKNIFYTEERIENFGLKNDIPVISISRKMSAFNWGKKFGTTKFHGFGDQLGHGHWNENGHNFVGKVVGEEICGILYEE
tara:strand:- start:97 stop:1329 length:1233 start_codon:yes stop_codon:yes gene_type:complete